jgi:hypothetical protein
MKTLFLFVLFVLSLSAFAGDEFATINQPDPNYCGGSEYCHKWIKGEYYARAVGKSCNQAFKRAEDLFVREYGNMECGLVSGPHLDIWSCRRNAQGQTVAWVRCSPNSAPRSAPRPKCAMIFGQLICN